MNDADVLKAVCCLAGADSEVTVEELQLLDGLAGRAGIEKKPLRIMIQKASNDDDFRQKQIAVVKRDTASTMRKLIGIAREDGSINEGHVTMLLWRVATKQLEISPERFEELLSGAD